jgi:glycerophosphoryl diester phosphodiesterase
LDRIGIVPDVPEIQGHRGARALRPENTLPGLAYALAIGVDAIEFDVTLTADDGLILAHDLTVDPQTIKSNEQEISGTPWRALTAARIAGLDAGHREPASPYDETFLAVPGTAVPSLDQVCALITGLDARTVTLAVELKTEPSWPAADVALLTQRSLQTLDAHTLLGQARILAFDWRVLGHVPASVPCVALLEPRTWVPGSAWMSGLDPADYGAPDAARCAAAARDVGASWVSPYDQMTSAGLIRTGHEEGIRVAVWTVNDPARMSELIAMDADAIITDRPDLLRTVLADHGLQLPRRYPEPVGASLRSRYR